MKKINTYIVEKLNKINSKNLHHISKYQVGDVIKDYQINPYVKMNIVCVISGDDIEDGIDRFIVDYNRTIDFPFGKYIIIDFKDENDINGLENSKNIRDKYFQLKTKIPCGLVRLNNFLSTNVYVPAIKELQLMYDNIDIINKSLKDPLDLGHSYLSSTQKDDRNVYALNTKGEICFKNKDEHLRCLPFIQIDKKYFK